jgi:hypothetical protein
VLKKLLSNPCAAVFGLLKLGDPVIDRSVELRKSFLLLEHRVVAELGGARRPEVLADASVEVAPASSEGSIRAAKVLSTLVELPELLYGN